MASATENPSKQFIEYLDKLKVPPASNTYNITGKSAAHVIAIFKSMVNREGQYGYRKGNVFTFKIGNPPTISFSLQAYPSGRHPGNGFIYRTGNKRDCYLYDEEFVNQLDEQYDSNTMKFAQDIKLVFKNNSKLSKDENNKIIQDVYFLLLFEIGRRLAEDDENVPEDIRKDKQDFDSLPISGAITKIVKLFEEKARGFKDVFLRGEKYHFAPCKGIQLPESTNFSVLESGILGFGIRNPALGIRNPANDWNPESKLVKIHSRLN